MRDPENCGACASRCGSGDVCYDGACLAACPGGFTDCSGTCRDLDSDRLNCGACDTPCEDGEVCDAGTCSVTCASPLVICPHDSDGDTVMDTTVCSDTSMDPANCGSCGSPCAALEACVSGVCQPMDVSTVGCADGTVEVTWNTTVVGCRGPTQSWQLYYDNASTYCAAGWVMATGHIVNTYLTGPGYTNDVKYAFDGELCDPSGWVFATRYDSYAQSRSSCGLLYSHHWSLGRAPGNPADGIVCEIP
jgi:hypothetical protein